MISLKKQKILTPLQNLPKNVEDLGKLIVVKGLKSCPKSNKSPNLVMLVTSSYGHMTSTATMHLSEEGIILHKRSE